MIDPRSPDHEPRHRQSATAFVLTELRLHGHRPFQDEPDSRPLPEERQVRAALADGSVWTRATEVETSNFRSRAGPKACAPANAGSRHAGAAGASGA